MIYRTLSLAYKTVKINLNASISVKLNARHNQTKPKQCDQMCKEIKTSPRESERQRYYCRMINLVTYGLSCLC